jgi:hypothetical protein
VASPVAERTVRSFGGDEGRVVGSPSRRGAADRVSKSTTKKKALARSL